jgi:hypothetical protein
VTARFAAGLGRTALPGARAGHADLPLHGAMAAASARAPRDFQELLLVPGVGARTVLALALAAEVIHGAPCRFSDPARFSLAHGGKDGHPFPRAPSRSRRPLTDCRRARCRSHLGVAPRGGEIPAKLLGRAPRAVAGGVALDAPPLPERPCVDRVEAELKGVTPSFRLLSRQTRFAGAAPPAAEPLRRATLRCMATPQ